MLNCLFSERSLNEDMWAGSGAFSWVGWMVRRDLRLDNSRSGVYKEVVYFSTMLMQA